LYYNQVSNKVYFLLKGEIIATERQLNLLSIIVDIYVKTGSPVSSGQVLNYHQDINISSATIRYEMVSLEEEGYLYKQDISASRTSARVPTNKAYEYYLENLKTNPSSIKLIQSKLDSIFKQRKDNIDSLLKEALEVINESTNTLTISTDEYITNTIIDIKTYKLSDKAATIVIITSNGEVVNKEIDISKVEFSEFETVINIFSKRLINTPINDIKNNSISLKEILEFKVKGLEYEFQTIINEMFAQIVRLNTKFTGMNSLISAENIDAQTQIKTIFKMIENNSI